jgi:hypothetical protein
MNQKPVRILTIGHSTRPIDVFLDLLETHGVRTAGGRAHRAALASLPHFSREALAASLASRGIEYQHVPELGGLRRPRSDSIHRGWRNEGFRGYADHMESAEFEAAIERLIASATECRLAVMCAEAVPWRCHRSLLSDALVVRAWTSTTCSVWKRRDRTNALPGPRSRAGGWCTRTGSAGRARGTSIWVETSTGVSNSCVGNRSWTVKLRPVEADNSL